MASSDARLHTDELVALCWAHNDHYLDVADLNFHFFHFNENNKQNFPLWKLLLPMMLHQWVKLIRLLHDKRFNDTHPNIFCDKTTSPTCFGLASLKVYVIMTHFAPTQVATHCWLGKDWCSVINVDNEACNDASCSFLELLRAIERNPFNPDVHLNNSSTTSNLTSSSDFNSCDVNANEAQNVSPSLLSLKPAHHSFVSFHWEFRKNLEMNSSRCRS